MADTITLIAKDEDGERILDEFEARTSLEAEADDGTREYALSDDDHRIDVVQTLTGIDEGWTEHIALEMPS